MTASLSHRGICVSDIDRSAAFYKGALDFEAREPALSLEGQAGATMTGLPEAMLRTLMIRNSQGVALELAQFSRPGATGSRERRVNNHHGLTHLAFYVDDIDAAAARIVRFGGAAFPHTRARFSEGGASMMYCTDPDGLRIELMHAADAVRGFSHSGICVRDAARSERFYCDVLGFSSAENYLLRAHSSWLDIINELDNVELRAQMMRNDARDTLELLSFWSPMSIDPCARSRMNHFGLTHLAIRVDDLRATAAAIEAAGGSIEGQIRSHGSDERLFCRDPNEVLLALIASKEAT